MLVLGIESSCDETAAAVVEGKGGLRVRSSVVATQHDLHAEYAGVVPEIASRAHEEHILPVIRRAVREAGIGLGDIEAVAVGHRPGLVGSLLVGLSAAKALAWSLGVPLVGVDHVHAHLTAAALDDEPIAFPALGLVVSGGHTTLYAMASDTELTRLGATIDDAAGEAYDKVAAILGLGHPGGPLVDGLASEPGVDDRAFDFPIGLIRKDNLNFSFSGVKTAVLYEVKGRPAPPTLPGRDPIVPPAPPPMTPERMRDIAASFQRTVCAALVRKTEAAFEHRGPFRTIVIGGGVSANSRLRREMQELGDRLRVPVRVPPMKYCVDNAAMIAGLGVRLLETGRRDDLTLSAIPTTAC
ncbi:MAG: tRNA (adenosine(37)-N6)-threonylcarbamoyltransferase complex transferase subunit TsaD [Phycisphaerales bacterium]|nr:tRNA (adenosine(37)-N6)-threonylcarbamoyltransferase complex transferase subunit TsaD [Planctomycetota bacterium]MCH8507306.1 tRNA (adenosine(37)-N6)-threonylcarbamoyltransferase complex transferase subunit TsaD [Phycisphaerales bacterium]